VTADRSPVCYVVRRNGAWLVHWVGTYPADQPEDDNFTCASSLPVAKRIAKEGAKGWAKNFRWRKDPEVGGWVLEGIEEEWEG
jgi:hypothetical protein